MTTRHALRAFEHQTLSVGDDSDALSLREAQLLAHINQARPGFCTPGLLSLRLAQYAGIIGLGERVLEILPKVDEHESDPAAGTNVLLNLLGLTNRIHYFTRSTVAQALEGGSLLDAFITAFLDEVSSVIRRGLLRRYRQSEDAIAVVRGRFLVERQIIRGGLRPDRLLCRYDDLTEDNGCNRALKAGLAAIRHRVAAHPRLQRRWMELTTALDGVALVTMHSADVQRIALDRQSEHYRPALQWVRLILAVLSPNLRGGRLEAPDLLFDMNLLFQSAVAATLAKRAKASTHLDVRAQDSGTFLASHISDPKRQAFALRPDIVVRQGQRVVAVADTKWTRVAMSADGHLLPSEQHVYQMHAYASAYGCEHFALIYPWYSGIGAAVPTAFTLPSALGRTVVLSIVCVDCRREDLAVANPVADSPLLRLFRGERLT